MGGHLRIAGKTFLAVLDIIQNNVKKNDARIRERFPDMSGMSATATGQFD